jgi:hypothetical protein
MGTQAGLTLRQRALEALEKSTKMLQVAVDLFEQGNPQEADLVHKEAQFQRSISTLLMAEAHNLDRTPKTTQSKHYNRTIFGQTAAVQRH